MKAPDGYIELKAGDVMGAADFTFEYTTGNFAPLSSCWFGLQVDAGWKHGSQILILRKGGSKIIDPKERVIKKLLKKLVDERERRLKVVKEIRVVALSNKTPLERMSEIYSLCVKDITNT